MPGLPRILLLAACIGAFQSPAPAAAQVTDTLGSPVAFGVIDALYARPVGGFHDHVKHGAGVDLSLLWPPRMGGPFAVRLDLGAVIYGRETSQVCFSGSGGCRVQLDVTTTNSILFLHAGPQLMVPRGPVRPYAHIGAGFSVFATGSEVMGTNESEPFASTTNHDDFTLSWTGGGGLLIALSRAAAPVMLNLGVRYVQSGEVEYLKPGDIQEEPDGSITIEPTRSEANLMSFRVGLYIPIRMAVAPPLEP